MTIEVYGETMKNLSVLRVECACENNYVGWALITRIQRRLTEYMNGLLAE